MRYMPLIVQDTPYRVFLGIDRNGPMHWHSEMELLICLSGSMSVTLEDQHFTLQAGDALILPGYVGHCADSKDPDVWRAAVNFGYSLLKSGYPAVRNTCLFLPANRADVPAALRMPLDVLTELLRQNRTESSSDKWRIQANLLLLCAYLQDNADTYIPKENLQTRVRRLDVIYKVLQYVEKHYAEKIPLEAMASLCGYATTYFCRQFKATTGISFYRYLTCYRVSVACMLLDNPRNSLTDIAGQTGFSTQTLFCRAFKEITSMTPKQFQALPQAEKTMTWMN